MYDLFYIHTAQVRRPTVTSDASMGQSIAYANVGKPIACSVQPASDSLKELYARQQIEVDWELWTETNPGLALGDIVTWNGGDYVVKGYKPYEMFWVQYWVVGLKKGI
jgi:hypothetical protein